MKNPHKYVGDVNNIIYRSSWELKMLKWADNHPDIVYMSSEEVIIPYYSPVDNKMHRYFVDMAVIIQKGDAFKKYLIEIKPDAQTKPPVKRSKKTNKYIEEIATYTVNQAKWAAADSFCKKNNMEFIVLTEKHLFG
jgi:hypothetical protein